MSKYLVLYAITRGHVIKERAIIEYVDQTSFDAQVVRMSRNNPGCLITFMYEDELMSDLQNIEKKRTGQI